MDKNQNNSLTEIGIATTLVILAALIRLLPHIPNATPIAAMALFGGAMLPKRWGWILPIVAMLATDALIGWYSLPIMLSVYGSFVLVNLIGSAFRNKISISTVLGGSLAGSLIFFVITNFAVWAWTPMYSSTTGGLIACYVAALPFLRGTLLGDIGYTAAIFSTYALAVRLAKQVSLTSQVL